MRTPLVVGLLLLAAASASMATVATPAGDVDLFGLALEDLARLPVTIATGSQQPLVRAPSTATVITADTIAAMGAVDLDQVLESVPGLHVLRAAGANQPLYEIRGIGGGGPSNPRVLMLQNGIPVNTLFTGDPGQVWGGYPVENIARIEVIRGPGSALYGADAVGGVINIITRTADDSPGTEIGVRGGNESTRDAWVRLGGSYGSLDVEGYVRVGSTEGSRQIIREDNQSLLDKAFGSHASMAPGPENDGVHAMDANLDVSHEHWRWRSGYKLRDEVGTGAGIGSALDPVGKGRSERLNSDISWTAPALNDNWGAGSTLSFLQYITTGDHALQVLPPGAVLPTGSFPNGMTGAPEYWDRQIRLSGYLTYVGFRNHQWRLGAGHDYLNLYKTQEFKNFTFAPSGLPVPAGPVLDYTHVAPFLGPHLREVNYAYLQDEWQLARNWTLTGGVRHDNYSDAGDTTNPRLALVWEAADNLTAKLLYGSAFRAPTFNEAYSINNPVERGNPDLEPETIRTSEADLAWRVNPDLHLNFSFFHYAMKQIIRGVTNATPGTGSTEQNSGDQTGRGGELEIAWDAMRNLRLSGNYAYQHATDNQTGTDAGYAPRRHAFGMADWRFCRNWQAGLTINWVADRARTYGDNRPQTPDYTTVDINLSSRRGLKDWNLAVGIRNLFSADVRDPSQAGAAGQPAAITYDIPSDPRTFYVQVSHSL